MIVVQRNVACVVDVPCAFSLSNVTLLKNAVCMCVCERERVRVYNRSPCSERGRAANMMQLMLAVPNLASDAASLHTIFISRLSLSPMHLSHAYPRQHISHASNTSPDTCLFSCLWDFVFVSFLNRMLFYGNCEKRMCGDEYFVAFMR